MPEYHFTDEELNTPIDKLLVDDFEGNSDYRVLPSGERERALLDIIYDRNWAVGRDPCSEAADTPEIPVIKNLLYAGCSIVIGGAAKKAMKTWLTLHLAGCIATGKPFLGFDINIGHVLVCNLEDGFVRTTKRLKKYGYYREGFPDNLHIMRGKKSIDYILNYIRLKKPAVALIDPIVELQVSTGMKDENDAIQVAKLLGLMRDIAQETGTLIIAIHHFNKGGTMRGSSAFMGSCDGWFELHYQGDKLPRRLQWDLRDQRPGEVDLNIEITNDTAAVIQVGDVRWEHTDVFVPESKRVHGKKTDKESNGADEEAQAVAGRDKVEAVLKAARDAGEGPLSISAICDRVRNMGRKTISLVLDDMITDTSVVKKGIGKGRTGYTWVPIEF